VNDCVVRELPSGRVTFLFTDIEGSTRLLRDLGDGFVAALEEHRRLLRAAFAEQSGVEVDTQGDAFFYVFPDARAAVAAAAAAQESLGAGAVRVRMGLHTGTPSRTAEGYAGLDVHLGARIAASGHGGQVLISRETRDSVEDSEVVDLGEHRLKDFDDPVPIFQLGDGAFPPLKTIANTNLPRPASSFVGRAHEVAEVDALLRDGARLLTLTGPGGSGKTRLSIEAASELVGEFRHGVFWVPLATLRHSELVLPTIAQTLGAQEELPAHIGDKELLLLVDNLEQVIDAAPDLAVLVEACPNLKMLVTSRELLRVRGEVEYSVLPLADPDAVDLFSARSGLDPAPSVEELCRRLDNMPLALELAAARTRALSPEQIVERLGERLDLFKGGRDADPRQATLRATIEWSHDLLEDDEQRLFARLAVFPSCTFEAAEAVCDVDLDLLQSLVEKSLVRHTDERFWMLETIREFAGEQLEASGEAEAVRRRHAEHFLRVAESTCLATERVGTGPMRYDVALAEQENLRAALDWALVADPELGLRIAVELEQFWASVDPFEGRRRFAALLDAAGELPPALRAAALRVLAGASQVTGDGEASLRLNEESLALYEQLGDEHGVVALRHRIAVCALIAGDLDRARTLVEGNLVRARALGSLYLETENTGTLGNIEAESGNLETSIELFRSHLELSRELGFVWFQSIALANLTELSFSLGRTDEAEEYGRGSLRLAAEMQDRLLTATALVLLGVIAKAKGDAGRAGRLWGAVTAEGERGSFGWQQAEIDRLGAQVTAEPTPELEEAVAAGRRLSLAEATDYALR
jgi:predicted ATPase/class 3 adenylate cyclase